MSTNASDHWPCECRNWCREWKFIGPGKLAPHTLHHPNCPHVDESLIDVWRVKANGLSVLMDSEPITDIPEGAVIEKIKMHREIYEQTEEFTGY